MVKTPIPSISAPKPASNGQLDGSRKLALPVPVAPKNAFPVSQGTGTAREAASVSSNRRLPPLVVRDWKAELRRPASWQSALVIYTPMAFAVGSTALALASYGNEISLLLYSARIAGATLLMYPLASVVTQRRALQERKASLEIEPKYVGDADFFNLMPGLNARELAKLRSVSCRVSPEQDVDFLWAIERIAKGLLDMSRLPLVPRRSRDYVKLLLKLIGRVIRERPEAMLEVLCHPPRLAALIQKIDAREGNLLPDLLERAEEVLGSQHPMVQTAYRTFCQDIGQARESD